MDENDERPAPLWLETRENYERRGAREIDALYTDLGGEG